MDIVPSGPGFGAELRGVTLADVAANDDVYSRNIPFWFSGTRR